MAAMEWSEQKWEEEFRLAEAAAHEVRERPVDRRWMGPPLPPLTTIAAEAEAWAYFSPPAAVEAWIAALYQALPPHRRRAFLRWASGQEGADG
jgi:hypothetical protein